MPYPAGTYVQVYPMGESHYAVVPMTPENQNVSYFLTPVGPAPSAPPPPPAPSAPKRPMAAPAPRPEPEPERLRELARVATGRVAKRTRTAKPKSAVAQEMAEARAGLRKQRLFARATKVLCCGSRLDYGREVFGTGCLNKKMLAEFEKEGLACFFCKHHLGQLAKLGAEEVSQFTDRTHEILAETDTLALARLWNDIRERVVAIA